MAERPRSQPARLLVLGAGAAQLGLLEAAAARDLSVIAVDRNPLAPGFAFADERAVISSEDEAGIERLARAREVDGIISPGADWPVGIAARVAEHLGLPHPISGATAVLATTKTRQRERFAAAGVLQPRTFSVGDPDDHVPLRRQGARPAGPARAHARPRAGRARGRRRDGGGRVPRRRRPRRGADRRPGADGQRRLVRRRVLPAHGDRQDPRRAARLRRRARARLAERARDRRRGRGGPGCRRARSGSRTGRATPRSGSAPAAGRTWSRSRPGSAAATTPSSAAAATGVDLNDLALSFALGDDLVTKCHKRWCRLRLGMDRRRGGGVRPLPRRAGGRAARDRRDRGGRGGRGRRVGAGLPAARAGASGRSAAAPTGPARSWPPGTTPPTALGAGSPCGGGRTLPGRCARLVAPSSASSLPRSGRRRSPPSSRRCAPAG